MVAVLRRPDLTLRAAMEAGAVANAPDIAVSGREIAVNTIGHGERSQVCAANRSRSVQ